MRTPITLKIKFKSASLDQFIERYSVDVSRGGIFIRTKEPLAVGTQLKFEFQLQDAQSLIAGEGTVVWIREHDPTRTGVAPGMGVRFDRLQPASQQVLDKILTEKSKRGDAQMESRFDAGVRASASASGTVTTAEKAAPHNEFGGGDSKSHTPLPAPVPGLDAHDEFSEESTRVMQNEIVQALADKTRGEDPMANFGDEPTRRASKEQLDVLTSSAAKPAAAAAPDLKPLPSDTPKGGSAAAKVEVTATESKPPVESKPAAAPAPAVAMAAGPVSTDTKPPADAPAPKRAEPAHESARESRPATATAPTPPPRRRSSMAVPAFLVIALVAAAVGYYALHDPGSGQTTNPPVASGDNPTAATDPNVAHPTSRLPPGVTHRAVDPAENPGTTEKPAVAVEKPVAPPPPVKPAGLTVAVTSDPPGAQVTVDGKALTAPTPTELSGLDVKKIYEVKVALKGFHDWKVKLKPKAGDKLDAALVPTEKWVEVSSTPAGSDVLLDGKRVGKTPFTIHKLDVSKTHALEVKHAGYVGQSRNISATDTFESKGDKDVLALALKLDPEPKAVAVKTNKRPGNAVKKPTEKPIEKPVETAEKPTEKPVETAEKPTEKPVETAEKPALEKPEKPAAEKPAAEKPEKPAAEKPAAEKPEKPAAEKPAAEKPAEKPAAIKVPSWMKPEENKEAPPAQ